VRAYAGVPRTGAEFIVKISRERSTFVSRCVLSRIPSYSDIARRRDRPYPSLSACIALSLNINRWQTSARPLNSDISFLFDETYIIVIRAESAPFSLSRRNDSLVTADRCALRLSALRLSAVC
jgi:hypothetical protein